MMKRVIGLALILIVAMLIVAGLALLIPYRGVAPIGMRGSEAAPVEDCSKPDACRLGKALAFGPLGRGM